MKDFEGALQDIADDLGLGVVVASDADLSVYECGKSLLVRELRSMADGSVVWVKHHQYGEKGLRMDGPYRISRIEGDDEGWNLEDGSSFGSEFYLGSDQDDEECSDSCLEGETCLYHAVSSEPGDSVDVETAVNLTKAEIEFLLRLLKEVGSFAEFCLECEYDEGGICDENPDICLGPGIAKKLQETT
jgi:hypothetical protein